MTTKMWLIALASVAVIAWLSGRSYEEAWHYTSEDQAYRHGKKLGVNVGAAAQRALLTGAREDSIVSAIELFYSRPLKWESRDELDACAGTGTVSLKSKLSKENK
ncbi:MAG: hypothetical protein KAV87_66290 [Desulfobacteraceae bacterium]|nr:hypothetical protein [Desulfobacteraceae bacterium]